LTGEFLFEERSHEHESFHYEELAWFRFGKTYHIRNKEGELVKTMEADTNQYFLGIANSNLLYQTMDYRKIEYSAYSISGELKFQLPLNTSYKLYQLGSNLIGLLATDGDYLFYDSLGIRKPYAQTSGYVGFHASDPAFLKQKEFIVKNETTEKVGMIDSDGNIIIDFKFEYIGPLINGIRVCVKDEYKIDYYDSNFKFIVTDTHQGRYHLGGRNNPGVLIQQKGFYEGVSVAWGPKRTIETAADVTEKEVYHQNEYLIYLYDIGMKIIQEFEDHIIACGNFKNGLAPALTNNKQLGFINKKGEWVIQPNYELSVAGAYPMPYMVIPEFIGDFVYIKSFKGYLDKNGKEYFSGKRMEDHYDFSH